MFRLSYTIDGTPDTVEFDTGPSLNPGTLVENLRLEKWSGFKFEPADVWSDEYTWIVESAISSMPGPLRKGSFQNITHSGSLAFTVLDGLTLCNTAQIMKTDFEFYPLLGRLNELDLTNIELDKSFEMISSLKGTKITHLRLCNIIPIEPFYALFADYQACRSLTLEDVSHLPEKFPPNITTLTIHRLFSQIHKINVPAHVRVLNVAHNNIQHVGFLIPCLKEITTLILDSNNICVSELGTLLKAQTATLTTISARNMLIGKEKDIQTILRDLEHNAILLNLDLGPLRESPQLAARLRANRILPESNEVKNAGITIVARKNGEFDVNFGIYNVANFFSSVFVKSKKNSL